MCVSVYVHVHVHVYVYVYVHVHEAEIAKCADPMQECEVCYPAYDSVQLVHYCLPDPKSALDSFAR